MDLKDLLDSRNFTYVLIAITLLSFATAGLALTGMVSADTSQVSAQRAGELVSDTLANSTGSTYDVVNVNEQSGVYAVDLNVQNQLQTVYVTKDAELFTTAMNSLSQLRETVQIQASTETCLTEKNATMYGNVTQQETQLQIQVMGGTNRVDSYYQDVNQQGVLQQAADDGVQSVPSFVVNGEVLRGINNITSVREFAGCTN
ncbi:hypothetical protein [Candidatus Nanohalococcus occultus]|uniref:Thioredoxin-like fold domain-containing protein n=1 Tax=Candidatus Nanohalococcus occultus TaxID=2978047 RepID=A0ABY8CF24_9ARCH|nr:hypothetical protein SVXNc_0810 [Candidatus Nanohaloarchaeota archaeon SVXNc]